MKETVLKKSVTIPRELFDFAKKLAKKQGHCQISKIIHQSIIHYRDAISGKKGGAR